MNKDLIYQLRKDIHKNPELSGNEFKTAQRVIDFLDRFKPDRIITGLGGAGIAAVFNSNVPGPSVMLRSELDALPITEINEFDYKSDFSNISHKCGHDGHTAILAGLVPLISENRIKKGRVILLFQPAEETGEGAERVLRDPKFKEIEPDFCFAMHNIPGYKRHNIVIKKGSFASASKGMVIKLKGKTAHASEPEKGINPALAIASIIQIFLSFNSEKNIFKDFTLLTIIHARLGEIAFGTSPGYGELMATLRAAHDDDMELLTNKAVDVVKNISEKENLSFEIEWKEVFPATINDDKCVDIIEKSSKENNLNTEIIEEGFRWSEDFGHFTANYKGALFGIGSGVNHPALHNPDYDFPEEIIETGIKTFWAIINEIFDNEA